MAMDNNNLRSAAAVPTDCKKYARPPFYNWSIARKAISRRTLLRGLGASLALPLLDAMVPAFAAPTPVRRFGVVYLPNGMSLPHFFPKTAEPGFALAPTL